LATSVKLKFCAPFHGRCAAAVGSSTSAFIDAVSPRRRALVRRPGRGDTARRGVPFLQRPPGQQFRLALDTRMCDGRSHTFLSSLKPSTRAPRAISAS
jgi:hypothetical protein